MAIFLMDKYYNLFIRNDIGEIIDIDDEKLRTSIDKKKFRFFKNNGNIFNG